MPGVAVSDLAPATAEDAEEFTQALELVLEGNAMALSGGWRLRADGVRRGVPKALGIRRVAPDLSKWQTWTPQQFADFLVRIRARAPHRPGCRQALGKAA